MVPIHVPTLENHPFTVDTNFVEIVSTSFSYGDSFFYIFIADFFVGMLELGLFMHSLICQITQTKHHSARSIHLNVFETMHTDPASDLHKLLDTQSFCSKSSKNIVSLSFKKLSFKVAYGMIYWT